MLVETNKVFTINLSEPEAQSLLFFLKNSLPHEVSHLQVETDMRNLAAQLQQIFTPY